MSSADPTPAAAVRALADVRVCRISDTGVTYQPKPAPKLTP